MIVKLTPELQDAIERQNGGPVQLGGTDDAAFVAMSMNVYRHIMGVGPDEDFAASVQAVQRGYQAIQAGKFRSFEEALDDLGRKHEVSN